LIQNLESEKELARIGVLQDGDFNPLTAALLVASLVRPGLKVGPYTRHMKKLFLDVFRYVNDDPVNTSLTLRVEALTQVVFRRYGYRGRVGIEHDPDGADLARVIDARSGCSEALTLIVVNLADSLGWAATPIYLPGRILVRLEHEGKRQIMDPFTGNPKVSAQSLRKIAKTCEKQNNGFKITKVVELKNRELLDHLLVLHKKLLLNQNRPKEALMLIEAYLLLAPKNAILWQECGVLHARLDQVDSAVIALEKSLCFETTESNHYKTSIVLQELRSRI